MRAYCHFMVAAAPASIAMKVMIEPSARVEMPETPWPIVQPSAVTPPKPISAPPIMWRAVSAASLKPSQRKLPLASAYAAEPAMTPAAEAMP